VPQLRAEVSVTSEYAFSKQSSAAKQRNLASQPPWLSWLGRITPAPRSSDYRRVKLWWFWSDFKKLGHLQIC